MPTSPKKLSENQFAASTATEGNLRTFFRRHSQFISKAEFAAAAPIALAPLAENGDMGMTITTLAIAWILATAGLFASRLSWKGVTAWATVFLVAFLAEGYGLSWYFHHHDVSTQAIAQPTHMHNTNSVSIAPKPAANRKAIAPKDPLGRNEIATVSFIYNFSNNELVEISKGGLSAVIIREQLHNTKRKGYFKVECIFTSPLKDIVAISAQEYTGSYIGNRNIDIDDHEQHRSSILFYFNPSEALSHFAGTEKIVVTFFE